MAKLAFCTVPLDFHTIHNTIIFGIYAGFSLFGWDAIVFLLSAAFVKLIVSDRKDLFLWGCVESNLIYYSIRK